jgi:hypothetical protein
MVPAEQHKLYDSTTPVGMAGDERSGDLTRGP